MLKTICYISNRRKNLSLIELEELYEQTTTNNNNLEITGALLLIKKQFIQVIEGESNAINTLFEKITNDERHQHIIVLNNSEIEKRFFKEFNSNYSIIDNIEKLTVFKNYIDKILKKTQDKSLKALVSILDDIIRAAG